MGGYYLVINSRNILANSIPTGYMQKIKTLEKVSFGTLQEAIKTFGRIHYLHDRNVKPPPQSPAIGKIFALDDNYFFHPPRNNTSEIYAPFPLHPHHYFNPNSISEFNMHRMRDRNIKILFSGNAERHAYDRDHIEILFRTATRFKTISFLRENINPKKLTTPKDRTEFFEILERGFNGLVLNDWSWSANSGLTTSGFKFKADEWLAILSNSEFFLCPAGTQMPLSFNLVESMAVGTIPLIQTEYAKLLNPPLTNGLNCITYDELCNLPMALDFITSLNPAEIKKMSQQAATYYEEHLSPTSLVKTMLTTEKSRATLTLNLETRSVNRLLERLRLSI